MSFVTIPHITQILGFLKYSFVQRGLVKRIIVFIVIVFFENESHKDVNVDCKATTDAQETLILHL